MALRQAQGERNKAIFGVKVLMLHKREHGPEVKLPPPRERGETSLEQAIASRRSVRRYKRDSLSLDQLSQILWAAQGITDARGLRAAPSAGATYPLEVFVLIGRDSVEGLEEGVYHYNVENHSLELHKDGDLRRELSIAALDEEFIAQAPVDIVLCAIYERTSWRYGRRAERYVHMEVGHVGQNIHLQAAALGLAVVMVGAFYDEEVRRAVGLSEEVRPLYIIPLGKPR
jgi:SagB-type dehydrogenase family enzyme